VREREREKEKKKKKKKKVLEEKGVQSVGQYPKS
jgi:hypothetical protein